MFFTTEPPLDKLGVGGENLRKSESWLKAKALNESVGKVGIEGYNMLKHKNLSGFPFSEDIFGSRNKINLGIRLEVSGGLS